MRTCSATDCDNQIDETKHPRATFCCGNCQSRTRKREERATPEGRQKSRDIANKYEKTERAKATRAAYKNRPR
jgi:hypothetical protein